MIGTALAGGGLPGLSGGTTQKVNQTTNSNALVTSSISNVTGSGSAGSETGEQRSDLRASGGVDSIGGSLGNGGLMTAAGAASQNVGGAIMLLGGLVIAVLLFGVFGRVKGR